MEDTMQRFHIFNNDFISGQSGMIEMAKANALSMELVKEQVVAETITTETWMPSKQLCKTNTGLDYNSYEIDVNQGGKCQARFSEDSHDASFH
jgi:hypothetical protein